MGCPPLGSTGRLGDNSHSFGGMQRQQNGAAREICKLAYDVKGTKYLMLLGTDFISRTSGRR